jgi:hypothetical protein
MRRSSWTTLLSIVVFAGSVSVALAVPNAPSNLKGVPGTGRITLQWTDNSTDELNFRLERSPDGSTGWAQIGGNLAEGKISYVDTTTVGKNKYFYRVRAENASGPSAWSNTTWSIAVYTGKPLATWIDVTVPRAGCDNVTVNDANSDSRGIQCRLNLLATVSGATDPYVLWFPNGEYRLDETVFLEGKMAVSLIGESTAGTIMKWVGPTGAFITVRSTDSGPQGTHQACDTACQAACTPPGCTLHQEIKAAVMFHNDGSKLVTFRNFTWDGSHPVNAGDTTGGYVVAFDESACGGCGSLGCTSGGTYSQQCNGVGNSLYTLDGGRGYNDTGSGHLDSVFKNAWIGLRIGHYNFEVDEFTVRRCTFLNNAFGISIEDFNALQEYIWDSRFEANWYAGITNAINNWDGDPTNWAGDFRVIRSRFVNNPGFDIHYAPTGYYTIRDNWSKGSGQFVHGAGSNGTRTPQTIIHNQVDAYDAAHQHGDYAIEIKNAGAAVLLDNVIDSDARTSPPVYAATFTPSDVFAVGNTYTIGNGHPSIHTEASTRSHIINDTLNGSSFDLTVPALPVPIDDLLTRPVYTVTDINNFQSVIDAATAAGGNAVVHVPGGYYPVSTTLTVPSGSSLHILGDGAGPFLDWTGAAGGTLMKVNGSGVQGLTIQGFWFHSPFPTGNRANALVVENLDQDQSRVFVNRVKAAFPASGEDWAGIDFDRLARNRVDVFDSGAAGVAGIFLGNGGNNTGYRVRVGSQQSYPMAVWTSTLLGNGTDLWVTNGSAGAEVLFSSIYMENSRQFFRVEGNTTPVDISIQGCKVATSFGRGTNAFSVENVGGNVAVISTQHFDFDFGATTLQGNRIEQSGSTSVEIQSIANDQWEDFVNSMGAGGHLTHMAEDRWNCTGGQNPAPSFCPGGSDAGWTQLTDTASPNDTLIENGFNLLRAPDAGHPTRPTIPGFYDEPSAQEAHQLNLDTIFVESALTGVQLTGGAAPAYFAPYDLSATCADGIHVVLAWSNSTSDATPGSGYEVYRAEVATPTNFTLAGTAPLAATTFTDQPNDGTPYYYKVRRKTAASQFSGYSNLADATTVIQPPTNLAANGVTAQPIVLTWTDNSAIEDNFHVYRSLTSNGTFTDITAAAPPTASPYSDTTVAEGTTYYYKVLAHDAVAGDSAFSNTDNEPAPTKAPTTTTAGAGSVPGIRVSWTDASSIETGYWIQRKLSTNPTYGHLAAVSPTSGSGTIVTYDDGTAAATATYNYQVCAGTQSNCVSLNGPAATAAMPGVAGSPNPGNGTTGWTRKRVLRWVKGSGSTNSDVYFSTNESDVTNGTRTSPAFKGTTSASCFNQNGAGSMLPNTTYYWRIDAVGTGGITKGPVPVWRFTTGSSNSNDSCP